MGRHLESRHYTSWQLIRSYWQSDAWLFAYFMLLIVIVMSVFLVAMEVVFTTWYNYFYDALQDYDKRGALDLLVVFIFLATVNIIVSVYRYYIQSYLTLRWRRWLTEQFLDRWLKKRSYYYLENFDQHTDNPDQRIQEDINSLVNYSLSLMIGLITSVVTIVAFIYVLWKLSGVIEVPLGLLGVWHIPGYLVWVSVIYAGFGTALTFKIGRPLVSLNFEQQRREANFRFAAIDVRSHAEHIALYRGEKNQRNSLNTIFSGVLENWYMIILRQKLLLWFTAGYNQTSVILPLAVALPNYFNKIFRLGDLMQSLRAFSQIQEALSFIVNSYTIIAEWQAVTQRLVTFINHMHEIDQNVLKENHFLISSHKENTILANDLCINIPGEGKLLSHINQLFHHGKNYIITGASGLGKSTFFRTLAGIWPYGSGKMIFPENKTILFLPQTSYMPLGTLRDALLFPDTHKNISDAILIELLNECDLPNLTQKLHHTERWSEQLSPGELQRIAFIRILIHRPDWVFLDESTSSLDLEHEEKLYDLLKKKLPHCSIISIGHRPSLTDHHDIEINLTGYKA